MIKQFRTKPWDVDAIQFTGCTESFVKIREWVGENFYYDYQESPHTWLSNRPVCKNDWVVKDAKGEFKVYKSDEFNQTFVEVE